MSEADQDFGLQFQVGNSNNLKHVAQLQIEVTIFNEVKGTLHRSSSSEYPMVEFLQQTCKANFWTFSRELISLSRCGSQTWATYTVWGLTSDR